MVTLTGARIEADTWYTELSLRHWDFDEDVLAEARRRRELRFSEPVEGQRLYLGRWLLEWLERKAVAL